MKTPALIRRGFSQVACHDESSTLREIRSIELIVQPGAKYAVGEMGVGGEWPSGQSEVGDKAADRRARPCHKSTTGRATRTCGVEMAKVHVQTFYFPSPVTGTPEIYHPLRAVAHYPTGVNVRLTEGLGDRRKVKQGVPECARALYSYSAVGQPTGDVGQHLAIAPHITEAATHRAEPFYFCLVIQQARPGQ